jgi:hypothetical protein
MVLTKVDLKDLHWVAVLVRYLAAKKAVMLEQLTVELKVDVLVVSSVD